jgi:tellurite resistance protein TehA-like permease
MSFAAGDSLARAARVVTPGSFSMVMATGIVSAALRLDGYPVPADVLLAVAGVSFVLLAAVTCWRAARLPVLLRADLSCLDRAFSAFAFPAACAVLASGLAATGYSDIAAALAAAAGLAWLAITILIGVRVLASPGGRPQLTDVNATWYLSAVATQSLVIAAASVRSGGLLGAGPAAVVSVTAWVIGILVYGLVSFLVAARVKAAGLGPAGVRPAYWIAMGAASIAVLAAGDILRLAMTPGGGGRSPVTDTGIALWALATCLIPVLAIATAVYLMRPPSWPRYRQSAWMVIFPLGMYATAGMQLGSAASLSAIRQIGAGFTWAAAAAWAVVFAAMAAAPLAAGRGRERAVQAEPAPALAPAADTGLSHHRAGRRIAPAGSRTRCKFQATLTFLPVPAQAQPAAVTWPTWRAVLSASHGGVHDGQLLTALVASPDGADASAKPHPIVTLVVVGPNPADCLSVGDAFTLWRGYDVASGVITRRLFV